MKILMLTPYLPYPPSEGGQVRSYSLIKRLSKTHEITLVSFSRQHNTPDQIDHMKQFCKKVIVIERGKTWTVQNILRTGFSLYPFLVSIYYSPLTKKILSEELSGNSYDLIHAEMFYTLPYLPKHNLPIILVEQTIMSRNFGHYVDTEKRWWLKPFMWIDVAKINFWQKHFWKKVDRVVTVSNEDAATIKRMVANLRVDVVPNGVGDDLSNLPKKIHYKQNILYMGNYKWIDNWEAAEILAKKVYPLIKKTLANVSMTIAGQFPTSAVRSLEDKSQNIKVVELGDSDFKGVTDAYLNTGLLIAPIYAPGGTRLKILAAMAAMVPVVTTPIGAEGYGAIEGTSILIGNTPEDLANKAIEVLNNKKLYTSIAQNARNLVDTKFSWEPITNTLESIYENLVHNHT